MKDENGLFYYPDPKDKKTRMYVRQGEDGVEFRMWSQEKPEIWERHPWLPRQVVEQAAALYAGQAGDPLKLYDASAAKMLIEEAAKKR